MPIWRQSLGDDESRPPACLVDVPVLDHAHISSSELLFINDLLDSIRVQLGCVRHSVGVNILLARHVLGLHLALWRLEQFFGADKERRSHVGHVPH